MTRAQEQTATLSGWVVTNIYSDGVIRIAPNSPADTSLIRTMSPDDPDWHQPFCFVRPDGSCGPVKTWQTVVAETRFRADAIAVRW
jgi:hypothetical protein